MLERVLSRLKVGEISDFERAEAILGGIDDKELETEVINDIVEKVVGGEAWLIDPVGMVFVKIIENSFCPECFQIEGIRRFAKVKCDFELLFTRMYQEGIDWEDLDKYTKYLLESECNCSIDDWEYFERRLNDYNGYYAQWMF